MSGQNKFYIKIANLAVEMRASFDMSIRHCRDYLIEATDVPDIVAKTDADEIAIEKSMSEFPVSDAYCEDICLYRSIAEQLPKFNCTVFHGAAVEVDGRGCIFTAPSGTGKTTHIGLWMEHFADRVSIINGDKPILKVNDDTVTVCSTPWAGKEGMQRNTTVPVGAICLIKQASENKISRLSPRECFGELVKQFYLPKDVVSKLKTLDIVDKVLKNVPIYLLECDVSREAAELSFDTITKHK